MSFLLTEAQVRARQKTVTRRVGWRHLRPGTWIQPVVKVQGMKKGEKVEKIGGPIEIVDVRFEPLWHINPRELALEGFPGMTPLEFVETFCRANPGATRKTMVTRIEFKYAATPAL